MTKEQLERIVRRAEKAVNSAENERQRFVRLLLLCLAQGELTGVTDEKKGGSVEA